MSVEFAKSDWDAIVRMIKTLPSFGNVRDRQRFITSALAGSPRAADLIHSFDLDGAAALVAVEVLERLRMFGQIEFGKQALGVFLNGLLPFVGDEDRSLIRGVFQKYPLDGPVAAPPPMSGWRGPANSAATQEKVIGENTFFPVYILELALAAARAVVLITAHMPDGRRWSGTGFVIGQNLVMTNHHVLATAREAACSAFTFRYQLGPDFKECKTLDAKALQGGLFYANEPLDYAVVEVQVPPAECEPPRLGMRRLEIGEPVTIVQHPGGHLKQISLRNNAVQYADDRLIQYTSSTDPGSSGSPIFEHRTFAVVGLHHAGGDLTDPASGSPCFRNEGVAMAAVLDHLTRNAPEAAKRIATQ